MKSGRWLLTYRNLDVVRSYNLHLARSFGSDIIFFRHYVDFLSELNDWSASGQVHVEELLPPFMDLTDVAVSVSSCGAFG